MLLIVTRRQFLLSRVLLMVPEQPVIPPVTDPNRRSINFGVWLNDGASEITKRCCVVPARSWGSHLEKLEMIWYEPVSFT